jgi:hypothetical protein
MAAPRSALTGSDCNKVMKTSSRWSRALVLSLIAASVIHLSARALFAQATVQFNNTTTTLLTTNSLSSPPPGHAPNQSGVTTGAGQYTIGLYIAPQGSTDPLAFQLMGPTTLSQSGLGNGRFNGNPVPNSFVISNNTGQPIAFQVRAWSTFAGPTYEAANGRTDLPTRYLGYSTIGQVTPATNGSPSGPPALFGTSAGQVGGFVLTPSGGYYGPPVVSITAPANGSLFSASGVVPVRVFSYQPDAGSVSSLHLLTNGVVAAEKSGPLGYGETNFTLSNLTAGHYTLRGRAANYYGLVATSAPVTVRVADRPVLEFARGSNGPIQFQFNSATGINYVVERGILTNFSPVITNAGTASPISYSETNGSATQRSYRVRLQ